VGLTLVRRLVELHGGSVTALSGGPGRGSELVVRLPIAVKPIVEEVPVVVRAASAPAGRRRVLVVDDNQDIITVLHDFLTWKGFDIHVAIDGPSALAVAGAVRPDVVLLDIGLPMLDGYEVARRLRADARFATTRLVALTGYGQRADLERGRAAGFHDHLVKPIDFDKLVGLLARSDVAMQLAADHSESASSRKSRSS
jgi:CheY-like chemotaxis protein